MHDYTVANVENVKGVLIHDILVASECVKINICFAEAWVLNRIGGKIFRV
mgnify:CR=1 FL=1